MGGALEDTICAIATPVGEGGIGIVRVSGARAIGIASQVVRLRSGRSLQSVKSHTLYYADILFPRRVAGGADRLPAHAARSGGDLSIIDEGLVVVMRRPRSFTAEDVVEFHCHGGLLVLQTLCEALVASGARLAEPGEFTKRAFLNGRLDLAQAEAVLDTIRAKTAAGLKLAQDQLRGGLSSEIEAIRESLIRLLAHVEAAIDFAEEEIAFVQRDELLVTLRQTIDRLSYLLETGREGRILREGAKVAIIGRPNVGKSSLMNALLRTDRAIVTSIPGTTRDVLEEILNVKGVPVRLLDTAGLRDTLDPVEQEGIRRTRSAIERADVILAVIDGSQSLSAEDYAVLQEIRGKPSVVVLNKNDLPCSVDLTDPAVGEGRAFDAPIVSVSAKTGAGLNELRERLRGLLVRPDLEAGEGVVVTNLRHQSALVRTREALVHAVDSVTKALSDEFVALDLRAAADALGEITGAVTTDEILERIFSEFCIGK
ncbi:MAG TPA: tRNA uridine-5-carboxymethylaminomethyl(34) synthesis GTPase MnmE [Nitrospiraceae bacterium]|jgi:tRNA modification GTPase|nr:tRNA uridine-5-carboxymethylaminomethyl(34) synthesis GTPase MnmE [Nitrospiraceae bacterium]